MPRGDLLSSMITPNGLHWGDSAAGTFWVARARAGYPNQLDYSGCVCTSGQAAISPAHQIDSEFADDDDDSGLSSAVLMGDAIANFRPLRKLHGLTKKSDN